jgi:AcrR family transcriptional regulator
MSEIAETDAAPRSTRDRLMDAAFAVVARDGLEAASVKSIAAQAGIAPGLVHYHFASKDALLEAALRRAVEDYRARGDARRKAAAPTEQIGRFVNTAQAALDEEGDLFRVRLAFAARALSDPVLAAQVAALNAEAAEDTALTFAAVDGRAQPTPQERDLARSLKALFEGVMLARLLDPSFPSKTAAAVIEGGMRAALQRLKPT